MRLLALGGFFEHLPGLGLLCPCPVASSAHAKIWVLITPEGDRSEELVGFY